jgi:hypothetical protein
MRFLRLRPAKFSSAPEPMIALDWLHSVNKDLVTVGCTDAEKVRFAAHLLERPAASWWDTFQITHPLTLSCGPCLRKDSEPTMSHLEY